MRFQVPPTSSLGIRNVMPSASFDEINKLKSHTAWGTSKWRLYELVGVLVFKARNVGKILRATDSLFVSDQVCSPDNFNQQTLDPHL